MNKPGFLRGLIISTAEGVIKRFSATTARGTLQNREGFQHYGFASLPLEGAEVIVLSEGNTFVSIAEDDRRFRLAVTPGEVALYTDEGDAVHLQRGRVIKITGGTKVILDTPNAEISGDLKVLGKVDVTGNVQAGGNVADAAGTMAAQRLTYNAHTHTDPQGGVSGPALPLM